MPVLSNSPGVLGMGAQKWTIRMHVSGPSSTGTRPCSSLCNVYCMCTSGVTFWDTCESLLLKTLPTALCSFCLPVCYLMYGLFQELEKINSELENEKKKLETFTSEIQEEYERIRE